jgi:BlaI family penicillinase repressor
MHRRRLSGLDFSRDLLHAIFFVDMRGLSSYTTFRMRLRSRNKPIAPPLPTDAELDILAVLWRVGVATVRTVHDELDKGRGYTTTMKQMQLMTEKGLIIRGERFGSHVYEPVVPKEKTQQQIAGDILRRAFEGSAKSLLLGALSTKRASPAELEEIRRMVETFQKGKSKS